jgi:hypothetical protein
MSPKELWRKVRGLAAMLLGAFFLAPAGPASAADDILDADTQFHMGGYAAVGYASSSPGDSEFNVGSFSPIFHYLYRDLVMLESELEFEVSETGDTEMALEYAAVDLFLNDNMTLVGGKFLSPLGQFRQNTHPSWVNKMPSAPPGFGHDQAAPNAEVGAELRGGVAMGDNTANYAVYIGNGPALEPDNFAVPTSIEKIETPGIGADGDGNKVVGGRLGLFLPGPKLEFGVSAATGKAGEWDGLDPPSFNGNVHSYQALGADVAYRPGNFDLRGEFIEQKVGDAAGVSGGTWQAWYLQAAYRALPSNWEMVARYGQYSTPDPAVDINQAAVGVNYLFSSNTMAKLAYESNENPGGGTAPNRVLLQLAYGF